MILQSSHHGGFCEVFFAVTEFKTKPKNSGNFSPISTGVYKKSGKPSLLLGRFFGDISCGGGQS